LEKYDDEGIGKQARRVRGDVGACACHDVRVTRQESDTELAGQLAASLTPRIQSMRPTPLQQRGEQNSGLFDIGAMYAASVEQVMLRAQKARKPVMGAAAAPLSVAHSYAAQAQHGYAAYAPQVEYGREPAEVYEDVDLAGEYVVIAGLPTSGRIGRFALAVAWLAMATLAAAISTLVPAHGLKKEVAPVVAAPAPAPPPAVAPTPAPAIATVSLSALPSAAAAATPTPATVTAASVTGAAPSAPTANLPATASLPHARPAAPAHPRAAVHAAPVDAAPAPVAKVAAPADSPPATLKAAPAKPAPAAPAAAPASGGSLEDLIRQAVAAEAKKPH
jgi:hypothetical protein